jgi:hypothetical protein
LFRDASNSLGVYFGSKPKAIVFSIALFFCAYCLCFVVLRIIRRVRYWPYFHRLTRNSSFIELRGERTHLFSFVYSRFSALRAFRAASTFSVSVDFGLALRACLMKSVGRGKITIIPERGNCEVRTAHISILNRRF